MVIRIDKEPTNLVANHSDEADYMFTSHPHPRLRCRKMQFRDVSSLCREILLRQERVRHG
jgi:hypothetical protein